MKEKEKNHFKKIRNMVILLLLTAVILGVSTYAWFIGMRTVNVSEFDVEIASTDSLMLSLDGKEWDYTVSINSDTYNQTTKSAEVPYPVYEEHTNSWTAMVPASSVGKVDPVTSRLVMYEKASLTATTGGYRLMASLIPNTTTTENPNPETETGGYVAFDLFVRNFSGRLYPTTLSQDNEEAVYLSTNSEVTVASTGVENTGIENSVRVAFAQIGRVSGELVGSGTITPAENIDAITSIKCTAPASGQTPICSDRDAQIWEPNDTKHVQAAINWYTTACKQRTALDAYADETCNNIANGTAYATYAVSEPIGSEDKVNVYDGEDYNGFSSSKLEAFETFTDTDKMQEGIARPEFFTLAPNSVTKVRVYIYIEGQDVDNYDFASIGKAISVKFGFTKERMTEEDVDYDGPAVMPRIVFPDPDTVTVGATFDPLANLTVTDINSETAYTQEELEDYVTVSGSVDTATAGEYKLTYTVKSITDSGVQTTKLRTVTVQ